MLRIALMSDGKDIGMVPNLGIGNNLLAVNGAITTAIGTLEESAGEQILEDMRQRIIACLIGWTQDDKPRRLNNWATAVRSAYNETKEGVIGGGRQDLIMPQRNTELLKRAVSSVNWSNCGKTSANIISGIPALQDQVKAPPLKSYGITGEGLGPEDLGIALAELPQPGTVLLLDCSFPQVHTFTIEVHPNGDRYICQGYQGVYFANWWVWGNEEGLRITKRELEKNEVSGDDVEHLTSARAIYGLGRPIGAGVFKDLIVVLVHALATAAEATSEMKPLQLAPETVEEEIWQDEKKHEELLAETAWSAFAAIWMKMPFCPIKREVSSVAMRGGRPELQVTRYEMPDSSNGTGASITVPVVPKTI